METNVTERQKEIERKSESQKDSRKERRKEINLYNFQRLLLLFLTLWLENETICLLQSCMENMHRCTLDFFRILKDFNIIKRIS